MYCFFFFFFQQDTGDGEDRKKLFIYLKSRVTREEGVAVVAANVGIEAKGRQKYMKDGQRAMQGIRVDR